MSLAAPHTAFAAKPKAFAARHTGRGPGSRTLRSKVAWRLRRRSEPKEYEMRKTGLLTLAFAVTVGGAIAIGASPANAQTTSSYGYQCFSTVSGAQYCSCAAFSTVDDATAWLYAKIDQISSDSDRQGNIMASHSDYSVQVQPVGCVN